MTVWVVPGSIKPGISSTAQARPLDLGQMSENWTLHSALLQHPAVTTPPFRFQYVAKLARVNCLLVPSAGAYKCPVRSAHSFLFDWLRLPQICVLISRPYPSAAVQPTVSPPQPFHLTCPSYPIAHISRHLSQPAFWRLFSRHHWYLLLSHPFVVALLHYRHE